MLHSDDVLAGRYRLLTRVGGGGMGDVWRSEDTILGRIVAVKVLRGCARSDPDFLERFRREARALAALDCPGIAEVYDYGETRLRDRELAYLVMQYVDGDSLSRRLALDGRLPLEETLRVTAAVADSLHIAHRTGVIHRDVKPGNIILASDGRVMLVDFGISRVSSNQTMTHTGVVLGTVTYMSPEQAVGGRIDPRSDVYSLGVVAHQCIAGAPPFQAITPLGVVSAHITKETTPLPPTTPAPIRALLAKAIASEADDRFTSAAEFAAACRAVARPQASMVLSGRIRRSTPAARATNEPPTVVTPPPKARATAPVEVPVQRGGDRRGEEPPSRRPRFNLLVLALLAVAGVLVGTSVTVLAPWQTGELSEQVGEDATRSPVAGSTIAPGHTAFEDGWLSPTGLAPSASASASSDSPSPSDSSSSPSPVPALVTVPDVTGLSEEAARQRLDEADLGVDVVYVGDGPQPCQVTEQDPAASTQVEPGSTVTITIHKGETCAT